VLTVVKSEHSTQLRCGCVLRLLAMHQRYTRTWCFLHSSCCRNTTLAHVLCVAGVAAAFRSPVGGVLFALEEMTSWFRNELLWYAFFTTAVVSVAGTHGDR
jgi:hypothetical protein